MIRLRQRSESRSHGGITAAEGRAPDAVSKAKLRSLLDRRDLFTSAGKELSGALPAAEQQTPAGALPVRPVLNVREAAEPEARRISVPLPRAFSPTSAEDLGAWQAANLGADNWGWMKEAQPLTSFGKVRVGHLKANNYTLVAVGPDESRYFRSSDVIWRRPNTILGGLDANQHLLVVTTEGLPTFEALRAGDGETVWKMPLPTWAGGPSQCGAASVHELPGNDLRLVTYRTQGRAGVFLLSPNFGVEELLGKGLQAPADRIEGVNPLSAAPVLSEEDSQLAAARWAAWESRQPKVDPPHARGPFATRYQYIPELPVTASTDGPAIISYTKRSPNPHAQGGQTLERRTIALGEGGEVCWQHEGAFLGYTQAGDLVLRTSGEHDYFDKSGKIQIVRPNGETIFSSSFNGRYARDSFRELPGGYVWFATMNSGGGSGGGALFGPDGAKLYEGSFDALGYFSENIPRELAQPPLPARRPPLSPAEIFANQVREAQARLDPKE
jgi:hypothetical protein